MGASLLERITGRRRAAEQKTIDDYAGLVQAVADDPDSVDPARADAILLDAAKTPDQLQADVDSLRQRRADAELAARLPALERERDEAGAKLGTRRDAVAKATREYEAAVAACNLRDGELRMQIAECQAAVSRLRASRPDPRRAELVAEQARLSQQRDQIVSQLGAGGQGIRGRHAALDRAIKGGPVTLDYGVVGTVEPGVAWDEGKLQASRAAAQGEINRLEGELANVDARLTEVNAALAEIERHQLSAE